MKLFIIALVLSTATLSAQGQSVTVQLTAQDVIDIQANIKARPVITTTPNLVTPAGRGRGRANAAPVANTAKPMTVSEWVNERVKSSIASLNRDSGRGMSQTQCDSLSTASKKELITKGLCK